MRMQVSIVCFAMMVQPSFAQEVEQAESSANLVQTLLDQGISREQFLMPDVDGMPRVCGSSIELVQPVVSNTTSSGSVLPPDTRAWECIPGVIRDDGVETFRLEVDVNGEVAHVTIGEPGANLIPPLPPPFELFDDGLGEDRVAGDGIFTAGPFRYNVGWEVSQFYLNDVGSPAGLSTTSVGRVTFEELDGTSTRFMRGPEVGTLAADIPAATYQTLASDVVVTPHLINIRGNTRAVQTNLRFLVGDFASLTKRIYLFIPDAVDIIIFLSSDKVERLPRTEWQNFVPGIHAQAQRNFTGGGADIIDQTSLYGSRGVLLGINMLDAYTRGILGSVAMHEVTHQWAAFSGTALSLTDGGGHYTYYSSTASPLGGFEWIDNQDGTYTYNCDEGRDGGHHAPPIDKYLMGLIPGEDVPTLHVNKDINMSNDCGNAVVSAQDVTIEDLQSVYGVRTPGPEDAQRSFRIAFVVESYNRLLNPTELTYYETLAEHFTRSIPAEEPDPYMGHNWPSMDRFFGEGTTWSTVIPVYFDVDANGQVDDIDYAAYAACHTGPAGAFEKSCKIFDRDKNAHVDLREFARFQVAFTGTAPSP